MKYFYLKNDEKVGPISLEDLSAADINKDTLVWYEGLDDWTPMSKIEELESISKTKSPSIPKAKPNLESTEKTNSPKDNLTSMVYFDDNGITIKASEKAVIGEKYEFNGEQYLFVDEEMLREMVKNGGDVTKVVTSAVTNMSSMFENADDFRQDIGSWDVSNVTNMYRMFWCARAFNKDIGSWQVSNVTDMIHMFAFAINFNQDISSWDVSIVTNKREMFLGASSFNEKTSSWTVSSQSTKMSTKKLVFIAIGVLVVLGILFNNQSSSESACGSGDQSCISDIRKNIKGAGKDIISEQYEGDGIFNIQFMDTEEGLLMHT